MVDAAHKTTRQSSGEHEQYVPQVLQTAAQLDPSSIRVPQAALVVTEPVRPGLGRPRASSGFLADLEARLAGVAAPNQWRWTVPHASYYSPQAIMALLDAEQAPRWRERVAAILCVTTQDLDRTLADAQRHWGLTRWAGQVFDAEFSAYAEVSRRRPRTRYGRRGLGLMEDPIVYVAGAVGVAGQRQQIRDVIAGHDGPGHWAWLLPEITREALVRKAANAPIPSLRRGVAEAAELLATRPPRRWTQLTTMAELVGGLQAARGSCLRDVGQLQRRWETTPPWRRCVRRALREAIESRLDAERAILERLDELQNPLRELEQIQRDRRGWECDHAEVLARGEIYAQRLQTLEQHALLALERDPPPYLHRALGRPFLHASTHQRGYWLGAARAIEHARADLGISDRHDPLGPTPEDPTARVRHADTLRLVAQLRTHLERPGPPVIGDALHRMLEPPTRAFEVDGP